MKTLILFFLQTTFLFAQANLDSLMKSISAKPDTARARILNDYAWINRSKNPNSALKSSEEALKIARAINNKNLQARSLNLMGVIYRNLGNYDKSISVYTNALRIAEEVKDSVQIAYSYNNLGGIYRLQGNNTLALEYILKALSVFENLKHKEGISFCTINIGLIYRRQGNYVKALEYLNYTLRLREEINDRPGKALALNLIAEVHFDLGEFNAALKYYLEVEKEYQAVDDKKGLAAAWGGIAGVYYEQKNYQSALEYRNKSLELATKINYLEGQVHNHINLGLIYAQLKNFQKADLEFAEALRIANSMKEIYVQIDTYKNFAKYNEMKNNYKEALLYFKKYTTLKDSIMKQENIALITEMEAIYKSERAEKEKTVLMKDLELREKQTNYLIIILLLIVVMVVIIYSRYLSKKAANKKLQELNAVKDTFFRLIAHDLKTPFNAIFGYTEMLKEDFTILSEEEKLKYITDIGRASKQSYQLLENLLLWSQSESGRIEFNPQTLNLKLIILESKELLMPAAKNKNIEIAVECDDNLTVNADMQMLTTIFRNLISNAIKFTYPGGNVIIHAIDEPKNVKISIKDNGLGMSDETVKRLFKLNEVSTFNGTQGEKGTGLGLILCKEFVSLHKGKIKVDSEPGKGSTFIFTIPK
ncbi:MAG: tetratricopeptide repeat-containing sensor histidine kinase [Melioribacter sp.]|nr:tetratricopeptide repeat-containing sensor histidine kinase [Melioribacter sp.]